MFQPTGEIGPARCEAQHPKSHQARVAGASQSATQPAGLICRQAAG